MDKKKLAIIGAGSSGLITLKHAIDRLPGWEICCFEKSDTTIGCWGNPYPGFKSTSTKYTTQFACYRKYDTRVHPDRAKRSEEFYKEDEFGRYLTDFAAEFKLSPYIKTQTAVTRCVREGKSWALSLEASDGKQLDELFDDVIICTGLTEKAKPIDTPIEVARKIDPKHPIQNKSIIVMGGGESAVDVANRLAEKSLHNQVYLSLKGGVRVSPRYHPIRGVPSDFLRNRLMLSIHENIRNRIGQKFVEARIQYQEQFERIFKSKASGNGKTVSIADARKEWDLKLTQRAKDDLFNMFHNKSDGFLEAVADGRIKIIGKQVDGSHVEFYDFDEKEKITLSPDLIFPMIGYASRLSELTQNQVSVPDFYQGCLHKDHDNLFLVGFARPIIGNIPSISEMQAKYVLAHLSGKLDRPTGLAEKHAQERAKLESRFSKLNTNAIYPVEMFTYCDELAKRMGTYPSRKKVGSFRRWVKINLAPVSTLHYLDDDYHEESIDNVEVYSPPVLTVLLLLIKSYDSIYRLFKRD